MVLIPVNILILTRAKHNVHQITSNCIVKPSWHVDLILEEDWEQTDKINNILISV